MKSNNIVRTIAEVGIFAAIGFVLDEIQGIAFASVFTAGGSIGFAMVAVFIPINPESPEKNPPVRKANGT